MSLCAEKASCTNDVTRQRHAGEKKGTVHNCAQVSAIICVQYWKPSQAANYSWRLGTTPIHSWSSLDPLGLTRWQTGAKHHEWRWQTIQCTQHSGVSPFHRTMCHSHVFCSIPGMPVRYGQGMPGSANVSNATKANWRNTIWDYQKNQNRIRYHGIQAQSGAYRYIITSAKKMKTSNVHEHPLIHPAYFGLLSALLPLQKAVLHNGQKWHMHAHAVEIFAGLLHVGLQLATSGNIFIATYQIWRCRNYQHDAQIISDQLTRLHLQAIRVCHGSSKVISMPVQTNVHGQGIASQSKKQDSKSPKSYICHQLSPYVIEHRWKERKNDVNTARIHKAHLNVELHIKWLHLPRSCPKRPMCVVTCRLPSHCKCEEGQKGTEWEWMRTHCKP